MRKATTVKPQMWQKPGFLRLSPDSRFVYAFLITGPDSNLTGIVRYPIDMVSMCTGLTHEAVEKALAQLTASGRIMWDMDNGIIFIIRWLKHNPIQSPKLVAGYLKYLEAFRGHAFSDAAARLIKHGDYDTVSIEYLQGIDTLQGQGQGQDSPVLSPAPVKKPPTPLKPKTARQASLAAVSTATQVIGRVNDKFGLERGATPTLIRAVEILLRAGHTHDEILRVVEHRLENEEWFDPKKHGAESLIRRDKFPSMLQVAQDAPRPLGELDFEPEPWRN